MEILLWLVPSAVVTAVAMAWVSWVSRDGRGEVDRDVAVERLAKALAKDPDERFLSAGAFQNALRCATEIAPSTVPIQR